MGGPENVNDIQTYLYNIFSDSNIIKLPLSFLLQKPLAKLISSRRAPETRKNYEAIGGSSPLIKWTRLVAFGVKERLLELYPNLETFIGMRYTEPYIGRALDNAARKGCRHIILFSLYPHYSQATTGTALGEVTKWLSKTDYEITVSAITDWYREPEYIRLLQNNIDKALLQLTGKSEPVVLFSAHSLPARMVRKGDPYLDQVKETVALAGADYDYRLSFQSRSGPVKWLEPETAATVRGLGRAGVKELVVVPVSFVSDHIETLHEIDIELKNLAMESGIEKFVRIDSFNDDPDFIEFLVRMIKDMFSGKKKDNI
jgi:ferrochelatase